MSRPTIHAAAPRTVLPVTASMLLNGWALIDSASNAGSLIREGGTVTWVLPSLRLTGADATADRIFTLTPGWRPDMAGNYGTIGWLRVDNAPVALLKDFAWLACGGRGTLQGIVSWPTADHAP